MSEGGTAVSKGEAVSEGREIRRAAVIGAGVMGAAIAAHLANAGIPSLLLDVKPEAPNEDEAAVLTGLRDPLDQARAFRDAGAANVVITQGEQGCQAAVTVQSHVIAPLPSHIAACTASTRRRPAIPERGLA